MDINTKVKYSFYVAINIIPPFALALILRFFRKSLSPAVLGFYCYDNTIDKPYRSSTVPFVATTIVFPVFAALCFICGKYMKFKTFKRKQRGNKADGRKLQDKHVFKTSVKRVLFLVTIYLYGAAITMFITHVCKYTTGRLRPHFRDVCKPIWSKINCTNEVGAKNYIVGDTFCKPSDMEMLKEARLSFPSGQTSFAAFSSTFMILYLEKHMNFNYNQWEIIPKIFVEIILGSSAVYIGSTRISDFRNHVSDVLAGFVLGIAVAVIIHLSYFKFVFEEPNMEENESIQEEEKINEINAEPLLTMTV